MKRRIATIMALVLAGALLCLNGCGSPAAEPTPSPEPEPTPQVLLYDGRELGEGTRQITLGPDSSVEELAALSQLLPQLEEIDFGSREPKSGELALLMESFPGAALTYSVSIAGQSVPNSTEELDLSGLTKAEAEKAAEAIRLLPALAFVDLGSASEDEGALTLEDVGLLQEARPDVTFDFSFEIFGRTVSTADEVLDFSKISMSDGGQAVRAILPYMTRCTYLDMDSCRVSNEDMAAIRDDFPQIKVVWRIYFDIYSVRTDVEKILASVRGQNMDYEDVEVLKYCTDVKYLDLGHNTIEDISFVSYMPNLEVAILAINYWSDATPLASCKNLEYLEVFNTQLTDLTPLAELTNLKHLNVSFLKNLEDITPLYGLTNLERLWIGCWNNVPEEQIETIRELLPDCEINSTTLAPVSEGWRSHERYELLREQFGYDEGAYSFK